MTLVLVGAPCALTLGDSVSAPVADIRIEGGAKLYVNNFTATYGKSADTKFSAPIGPGLSDEAYKFIQDRVRRGGNRNVMNVHTFGKNNEETLHLYTENASMSKLTLNDLSPGVTSATLQATFSATPFTSESLQNSKGPASKIDSNWVFDKFEFRIGDKQYNPLSITKIALTPSDPADAAAYAMTAEYHVTFNKTEGEEIHQIQQQRSQGVGTGLVHSTLALYGHKPSAVLKLDLDFSRITTLTKGKDGKGTEQYEATFKSVHPAVLFSK